MRRFSSPLSLALTLWASTFLRQQWRLPKGKGLSPELRLLKFTVSLISIHANALIKPPGKATFKVLDFFKYTPRDKDRYDLIFDYL
jgi:hypothetical protein